MSANFKKLCVNSGIGLKLRTSPDASTEKNKICVLSNNQEVEVIEQKDKWYKINCLGKVGWVSAQFVSEKIEVLKSNITPVDSVINFDKGKPNLSDNPNTIKLRQIINDALTGGKNGYCLQCTEYVQYQIKIKTGIIINWPVTSGRNGGRWAEIFRKANVYKVLDEPKKFTAASFTNPNFNAPYGHVSFVEDVLPDGSIKISEANWPPIKKEPEGEYNERILDKKYQKAKMIQFIDFN